MMIDGGLLALILFIAGADARYAVSSDPTIPVNAEVGFVNDGRARASILRRLPLKERTAVRLAVDWLLEHQDDDGRWDTDEFMKHDPPKDRCRHHGQPEHDVGITSLALLALMGGAELKEGNGTQRAVEKGLVWLVAQQDAESGLIGGKLGHSYLYNHGLAATCLAEAIIVLDREDLKAPVQKAVDCIQRARNPNSAWRYEFPPVGDNDTSVTALMVTALATAREAGSKVDSAAFEGALSWIDEVTQADNGRVGYDSTGSASSRVPGVNDEYPVDRTEVMTAAGLSTRLFCGQLPENEHMIPRHAELILTKLPEWSSGGLGTDFYYWYHGSTAIHMMGEKSWKIWKKALVKALGGSQQKRGSAKGSWDPVGPWGFSGGRVYSTAIGVICLTAPVRHRRLTGD